MGAIDKLTVSLSSEQASFIDDMVSTGVYATAGDVVRAGLVALREYDDRLEQWLTCEVASVFDAMKADPSRGIPADQVFAEIRARHAQRLRHPT